MGWVVQSEIIEGEKLAFARWESWQPNRPILVMIHGSTFNHRYYDSAAPVFSEIFNVLAVDLRGHGDSEPLSVGDPYSISLLSQDLNKVLDRVCPDKMPVALLGTSLGSAVALEFAIQNPGSVSHLIIDLPAYGPKAPAPSESLKDVAENLMVGRVSEAAKAASRQVPDRYRAGAVRFFEKLWAYSKTESLAAVLLADRQFDCRPERLNALPIPTLVCGHRHDPVHPWEAAEWLSLQISEAILCERSNPTPMATWAHQTLKQLAL